MKKAAGILLLGLAACSDNTPEVSASFDKTIEIAPEHQAIVGGRQCTAESIKIAIGEGLFIDMNCPKGRVNMSMTCPGYNLKNNKPNCPGTHTIRQKFVINGINVSDRMVPTL